MNQILPDGLGGMGLLLLGMTVLVVMKWEYDSDTVSFDCYPAIEDSDS